MASALAGILAYGLMQMDGISGLEGWRWVSLFLSAISLATLDISHTAYTSYASYIPCIFSVSSITIY